MNGTRGRETCAGICRVLRDYGNAANAAFTPANQRFTRVGSGNRGASTAGLLRLCEISQKRFRPWALRGVEFGRMMPPLASRPSIIWTRQSERPSRTAATIVGERRTITELSIRNVDAVTDSSLHAGQREIKRRCCSNRRRARESLAIGSVGNRDEVNAAIILAAVECEAVGFRQGQKNLTSRPASSSTTATRHVDLPVRHREFS